MVLADADGESVGDGMHLQFGEGERSHGRAIRVVVLVVKENLLEAARYLLADEDGVGRVLVALDVAGNVAGVPGLFLGEDGLDDVEFEAGGGVESIVVLGGHGPGRREQQGKRECAGSAGPHDP